MTKDAKEGARAFSVLVQQIEEGALHSELSEKIQEVCADLACYSAEYACDAKGQIKLTLDLKVMRNGTVNVGSDVVTKTPKRKRAASTFWLTKGNNLSPENPRQTKLPLREVAPPPMAKDEEARHG